MLYKNKYSMWILIIYTLFSGVLNFSPAFANKISFNLWLEALRTEAIENGIKPKVFDNVMSGVKPVQKIIDLDRKQPERTITFEEYKERVVTASRIRKGRRLQSEYIDTLKKIEEKYGVQKRFILALWAIETDFGRNVGGFYVPAALATLAYDGRRSQFFREELLKALKIINDGHVSKEDMKGSWAGAMGQSQFMPSSFLNFAVDYDGDKKKDIWRSRYDVFASIANYLDTVGWNVEDTWGRKVELPNGFDMTLNDIKISKTLLEWQKLGVRRTNGKDLPIKKIKASLIAPNNKKDDAFLIYDNYKTILNWNKSNYFALSVGILSDAIGK